MPKITQTVHGRVGPFLCRDGQLCRGSALPPENGNRTLPTHVNHPLPPVFDTLTSGEADPRVTAPPSGSRFLDAADAHRECAFHLLAGPFRGALSL